MKLNHKSLAIISFALVLAPAAFAWDSPEVALVLNQNADHSTQVNRYDVSTGTMLGSYAYNNTTFTPTSIQEVGNTTHVMGTTNTGDLFDNMYNMSTGQYLGSNEIYNLNHSVGISPGTLSIAWMPNVGGTGAYLFEAVDTSSQVNRLYDTAIGIANFWDLGGSIGQVKYDPMTGAAVFASAGAGYREGTYGGTVIGADVDQNSGQVTLQTQYNLDANSLSGSGGNYDSSISAAMYNSGGIEYGVCSRAITELSSSGQLNESFANLSGFNVQNDQGLSSPNVDFGSAAVQVGSLLAFGHSDHLYDLDWKYGGGAAELTHLKANGLGEPSVIGGTSILGLYNPLDMTVYAAPEPSAILGFAPLVLGLIWKRRSKK